MKHEWKEIAAFDSMSGDLITMHQCSVCNVVRRQGDIATYYWRGEVYDFVDPENDCAKDVPVPLESILRDREPMSEARQIWTLLHYNAPQTHIDTILEGFEQIFTACGSKLTAFLFRRAKELRHKHTAGFINALMSGELDL